MKVEQLAIPEILLITLKSFPDDRGFFCERFKFSDFSKLGLPTQFVQSNFSRSKPGVLRGLHYQYEKPQGKLVTCLSGEILDVVVDIRIGSKTFGQSIMIPLSGSIPKWVWVPAGFAHGFCVEGSTDADVFYQCDAEYNPKAESGIRYDDSDLKISWPSSAKLVSSRDQLLPTFKEYQVNPAFRIEKVNGV